MPEQSLSRKEPDGEVTGLQRLASPKAILPWLLTLWALVKLLYQSLNFASVAEFAAGLGGNPHMKAIWTFATSGVGTILITLLGIAWLSYLVLRKPKELDSAMETASDGQSKSDSLEDKEKPSIEIFSPFDGDVVGFHEVVRGRVSPPNSRLQVLVFAGDQKWYPQPPVDVKDSNWSVKCQFGSLDVPSGGLYKLAAVSGNSLSQHMWYTELPETAVISNVVTVNRVDITTEHALSRLSKQLETAKEAANQIQAGNNILEDKLHASEDEVQRLNIALSLANIRENKLEQELSSVKELKETADRSVEINRQEVRELAAKLNTQLEQSAQYDRGLREQTEYVDSLRKMLEESRKEKLAAASNLHGVETDRNNYRTWFNELAWLKPAIKEQQRDISNHVQVLAARPCLLDLKKRVVIIDLVIRNDSLFDITIKGDTVSGRLLTEKNGLLHDPAKAHADLIHHPIENLKPTQEARVAIIQPLLKTEAEDIEDAIADGDGCFWLGNLNIPISVENAEPLQVDSKPLRINSDVENIYFREFGALTFNGEVITPKELLRNVESLPFPERARIYLEISKAYGESLWRLNEAEEKKDPEDLAQESISRNTKKP